MLDKIITVLKAFLIVILVMGISYSIVDSSFPLPLDPPSEESVVTLTPEVELAKKLQACTVRIIRRDRGSGTGSIISKNGLILTNKHVVDNYDTVKVLLSGPGDGPYEEYIGRVVAISSSSDLALVKIDLDTPTHLTISDLSSADLIGSHVTLCGFPFGYHKIFAVGVISGVRDGGRFGMVYPSDVDIYSGHSGSAVVTSDGKLVGVASGAESSRTDGRLTIIVAVEGIRELIVEYHIGQMKKQAEKLKQTGAIND